jgi:hypothetical protein
LSSVRGMVATTIAVVGVLGGMSLAAAPALAVLGHGLTGSFGKAGHGEGEFEGPSGVAVNEVTPGDVSDVYVIDAGNNRVERFSASGAYLGEFNGSGTFANEEGKKAPKPLSEPRWVAVDNSGKTPAEDPSVGDVYVTDNGNGVIDKFSPTGAYLGQITTNSGSSGMAVDRDGLVWALLPGGVDSYSDALVNEPVSTLGLPFFQGGDPGLGVDSEDNIYLAYHSEPNATVFEINSVGMALSYEFGGERAVSGIAADPSDNDVYFDHDGVSIGRFSSSGSLIERFGEGHLSPAIGIGMGIDSASGTVYVANPTGGDVEIFTLGPRAPAPSTEAPENVTATTATLHGELLGEETEYYFAYNTNGGCTGASASPVEPAAGTVKESANVTGLQPSKKYTYCIVAKNNFGPEPGSLETFETLPAPPELLAGSEQATALTPSEGRLEAQINPNNQKTRCEFQYEAEEPLLAAPTTVPCEAEIEGFGGRSVGVKVPGLELATTYYYRVVAENAGHERTEGEIERFSKAPIVANERVSGLTSTGAALEATIDPDFQEVPSYAFEYATSEAALGTAGATRLKGNPPPPLPAGSSEDHVSTVASGLQPGATYYYRVVAENATTAKDGIPGTGTIKSFTPYAVPAATTGEAQDLTGTSAVLTGTVNAQGTATTYYFAYIDQAGYERALAGDPEEKANPYASGETTLTKSAGSSFAPQTIEPTLAAGLRPGETYDYALIATNQFDQKDTGPDAVLTTLAGRPPVVSTGPASAISQNSATLSGTVATSGLQSEYGFEIATEPGEYGPATGLGSIGGSLANTVTLTLSELQPGTTYYYRVTASSADGTSYGEPETFSTPGFPSLLTASISLPLIAVPDFVFPTGSLANTGTPTETETKTKTLSNAQKLGKALRVCHKDRGRAKRASCEKAARKKYGHGRGRKS